MTTPDKTKPPRAPRRKALRTAMEPGGADRRMGRPPLLDDPRAQILQAAAKLFADKGYAASS
ncbi:MAG: hypothetical protein B7Z45_08745, partial [Azorhizobium sp. 12-66-6]